MSKFLSSGSLWRFNWLSAALPLLLLAFIIQTQAQVVESGKFRLHKFEQAIGEENYEITREGDSLLVRIHLQVYGPQTRRAAHRSAAHRTGLDARTCLKSKAARPGLDH